MANPTTNFGWVMPTSTDLVTDLPADFAVFGQAVDTSMADLKGGTTGQILSKNSNTDMDFTWVTQDDANAIQNSIVDAKGDLISATAADTPARLAVGTDGQILTADSTTATGLKWATASSGGTYSAWTPTRTNWSLGNGTETARYTEIGKFVHLEYKLIWGSTSSISGDLKISLPVTAKGTQDAFFGDVSILDSGTAWYLGKVLLDGSTTTMSFVALKADSTYQTYTTVAASAPMSWATNDRLIFSLVYEAA